MRVDVSEVKSFRNCKRGWAFSSRNKWNLKSKIPSAPLYFGTLFHDCLARLYMGEDLQKICDYINRELGDPAEQRTMTAMICGYAAEVLPQDMEEYIVKDIEHHFELEISPFKEQGITLCGSIDMICLKEVPGEENVYEVWGFEHKSCARFRDSIYTALDEQPRLYTIALAEYVKHLNELPADKRGGATYRLGGIFLNEVRKIQRSFDHKRTTCVYSSTDLDSFLKGFFTSCMQIREAVEEDVALPDPGQMKCVMCNYKTLCEEYAYAVPERDDVLDEFSEEFEIRKVDHLDEKQEQNNDIGNKE